MPTSLPCHFATLPATNTLSTLLVSMLSGADIARSNKSCLRTLYPILFCLERAGWLESRWRRTDAPLFSNSPARLWSGAPQRPARPALASLLQLIGQSSDQQIANEAEGAAPVRCTCSSQPQLLRRSIDQPGNLAFDLGDICAARSAIPALSGNGRRPARALASRSVVD